MVVTDPIWFFDNFFGLQRLCDNDPGVMGSTLCPLYDLISEDVNSYKDLVVSFVSILKQVAERRLPKSYDYHQMPAPFIQVHQSKFQFDLLLICAWIFLCESLKLERLYFYVSCLWCELFLKFWNGHSCQCYHLLFEGWTSDLADLLRFKSFHPNNKISTPQIQTSWVNYMDPHCQLSSFHIIILNKI